MSSIVASLQLEVGQFASQLNAIRAQIKQTKSEAGSGQSITQAMVTGKGGKGGFANIGMASMQVQDIAVQLQSGTKAATVFAQQGSQLLSMFGPGGMIIGGLVAAGGLLITTKQKSDEAFAALVKGNAEFDTALQKTLSGSMEDMISSIERMKKEAAEMQTAQAAGPGYFDPLRRFFSTTTFDDAGKGTNQFDAQKAAEAEALQKRLAAIQRLEAASSAEKAFKEADAILTKQQEVDKQKRQAALAEMTTAQQIAALQVEMNQLTEHENALRADFVPDQLKILTNESQQITLKQQILSLQKQLVSEQEREADAAARQEQQQQQKSKDRNQALTSLNQELRLLEARATGRDKDIQKAERLNAIEQRRDRLMQQLNMPAAQATAIATQMRDMEEGTGRRGVQNRRLMGGLSDFHLNQRTASQWKTLQSGQSQWSKLQQGESQWQKLQRQSATDRGVTTTMENMAARNNATDSPESIAVLKDIAKTLRSVLFGN